MRLVPSFSSVAVGTVVQQVWQVAVLGRDLFKLPEVAIGDRPHRLSFPL